MEITSNTKDGSETCIDPELIKKAEEYKLTNDLRINAYLDVKDTTSAWCLAQIIDVSHNKIRVHYDGWSNKYDEVI